MKKGNSKNKISEKMKQLWKTQIFKEKTLGYKHSIEIKNKISKLSKGNKSRTGQHLSDETKRKLSLALTGKSAWNKGIPCNEETKLKISQGLLNSKCNLSEIHKGQKAWNKGRSLKRKRLTIEDIEKIN